MPINKIDGRGVYAILAPEASLGVFPVAAKWRKLDLKEYSEASSSYENATREVMDGSRRARKGKQSSKDVNFGYSVDVTKNNTLGQIASFMFGVPVERYTTRSAFEGTPLTTKLTNSLVSSTATTVTATSTLAASLAAGDIIVIEDGVNDRVPLTVVSVATVTATFAVLNAGQVFVPSPVTTGRIVRVGVKAAAADLVLAATATAATLTTTALNFVTMGLTKGEWVFVGGDAVTDKFAATPPFYARIADVAAKVLTFDTTTSPIIADTGAGKTVTLYFGTFIADGDTRSSYTHARYLGKNDAGNLIVENFTGCVPNELGINFSEADFMTLDLAYVAVDHRANAINQATFNTTYPNIRETPDDDAYHTATDIFRQRLSVVDAKLNPAAITSFVQEATVSISNNMTADTRNGKLGAFDFSMGQFGLTGSITAYFVGIEALEAVRCNCTVGMDIIIASKNAGSVLDMPAFTIGGSVDITANESIKLPLEQAAFRSSKFGYMLSYTAFNYLPSAAMPEGQDSCAC